MYLGLSGITGFSKEPSIKTRLKRTMNSLRITTFAESQVVRKPDVEEGVQGTNKGNPSSS
jgi:hypothetical protein